MTVQFFIITISLTSFLFVFDSFGYQLVVYPGLEINASSVPIISIDSPTSPIIVNPEHFGESGAGKIYTMAIRLKTKRVSVVNG